MRINKLLLGALCGLLPIAGLFCTGGTSESGNARCTVVGSVVKGGAAVSGARVQLVADGYVPGSDTLGKVFTTSTDEAGGYQFEEIPKGLYFLNARFNGTRLLRGPIGILKTKEDLSVDTLSPTARLTISVSNTDSVNVVFIQGLTSSTKVLSSTVVIDSVPPGTVTVVGYSQSSIVVPETLAAVNTKQRTLTVAPGDTARIALDNTAPVYGSDTEAPVITLLGSADTIIQGCSPRAPYRDPGFTASDNAGGDIHARVRVSGSVEVNKAGVYTLTYNVTDSAGNHAAQKTRTVHVYEVSCGADSTKPEIVLFGNNPDSVLVGASWMEPGYSVWDNSDTSGLGAAVTVTGGPVITTKDTFFLFKYSVKDLWGNQSTTKMRVVVVYSVAPPDTMKPEITLTGTARCSTDVGTKYYDKGATAIDRIPGSSATINVSNKITTMAYTADWQKVYIDSFWTKIGVYYIVYNVSDAAGNKADSVKRTVYVRDTTPPPPDTIFAWYEVPTPDPLPPIAQGAFGSDTVYTDGSPKIAPKVASIKEFSISWDTADGGLVNQFSLFLKSGMLMNFLATSQQTLTQSFGLPGPKFTISGTGIADLDGEYFIRINGKYCYWVRTNGVFAIIFKKL